MVWLLNGTYPGEQGQLAAAFCNRYTLYKVRSVYPAQVDKSQTGCGIAGPNSLCIYHSDLSTARTSSTLIDRQAGSIHWLLRL